MQGPDHCVVVSLDYLQLPVVVLRLLQLYVQVQNVFFVVARERQSLHGFLLALGNAGYLLVLVLQLLQHPNQIGLVVF